MNAKSKPTPSFLFAQWQTEDRQLGEYVQELQAWMKEVNDIGIPHFGEAGDRLRSLRGRLQQHFDREDDIIEGLEEYFDDSPSAVGALRNQSSADHQHIMHRLDGLMERLNQLEPPFKSWLAAMGEIESFVSGLAQHEREESDTVAALLIVGESHI
jgi:hypothetical protein